MYFGFDRLQYPGGDVLAALKATGAVHFVAAYLAPAPSQHSTTWMPHVADLQAAGWGIVPIYVGQQAPGGPGSHHLTVDQAHQDATNVADLAATAQLPDNSVVYLDVEAGGTLAADHLAYVTAWIEGVKQTAYRPGVYCSARTTATQIVAAAGDLPIWVYRWPRPTAQSIDVASAVVPDPADSGYAPALVWQYQASGANASLDLTWQDTDGNTTTLVGVDVNASVVPDPSMPVLPTPQIYSVTPLIVGAGDEVTIVGDQLVGIAGVGFAGVNAGDISIVDNFTLLATAPAGVVGEDVLTVVNRWGIESKSDDQVRIVDVPTVTSIQPQSGEPGIVVRLTGACLGMITDVGIGDVNSPGFALTDDGALNVTVPAGNGGSTVSVSVAAGGAPIDTGLTFSIEPVGVAPDQTDSGNIEPVQ